jgi:hypothetical protein
MPPVPPALGSVVAGTEQHVVPVAHAPWATVPLTAAQSATQSALQAVGSSPVVDVVGAVGVPDIVGAIVVAGGDVVEPVAVVVPGSVVVAVGGVTVPVLLPVVLAVGMVALAVTSVVVEPELINGVSSVLVCEHAAVEKVASAKS